MKKYLKSIIILTLIITMCLTINTPVWAATEKSSGTVQQVNILEGNSGIIRISEIYDVSYQEAEIIYDELRAGVDRLEERYVHCDVGAGYKIELGCLVRVQCGSGHCNYVSISKTWSKAIGDGVYSWDPFYVNATIVGSLKDGIHFQSRGNLEIAVNQSMGASVQGAGFSFTGTVGTTYHYRKTVSVDQTL